MLENITEEEYNLSQEKVAKLRKELFDVRYAIAITRDIKELKSLEKKADSLKKEIGRTTTIMKVYELENNIESKKRGK